MIKKIYSIILVGFALMICSLHAKEVDRRDVSSQEKHHSALHALFYLNKTPASFREKKRGSAVELYIDSEFLNHYLSESTSPEGNVHYRHIELPSLLADGRPETIIKNKQLFSLPMPQGGELDIYFSKIKYYGKQRYTLFGQGYSNSHAQLVLARAGQFYSGSLFVNGKRYHITAAKEDTVRIAEDNREKEAPEQLVKQLTQRRAEKTLSRHIEQSSAKKLIKYNGIHINPMERAKYRNRPAVLDIIVFYTLPALREVGRENAMLARAQSSIDTINLVMQNSGVRAEARLVAVQQLDFAESSKFEDNIDRFAESAAANSYRDQYGADLAQLFLSDPGEDSLCGLAYRPPKNSFEWSINRLSGSGFLTINIGCSDFTAVHELGHTLGMTHDKANSSAKKSELIYPYAYGYVIDGVLSTIMAYGSGCSESCPRIPYFSNPYINYYGYPIGIIGEIHNAAVADYTSAIVSQYRASKHVSRLTNLTGLWFDPQHAGSGFNFITKNAETLVTYYGYSRNGERLWLISDENLKPKAGVYETIPLYETTEGTLAYPQSRIEQWGTLTIMFENCTNATAIISGRDGSLSYSNLVLLSASKDIPCN